MQRIIRRNLPNSSIGEVITDAISTILVSMFILIIHQFTASQSAKYVLSFLLGLLCSTCIKRTVTDYKSWRNRTKDAADYAFLTKMSVEELTKFLEELTEREANMREQIDQENVDYQSTRATLDKEHRQRHEQLVLAYDEEHFSAKQQIASKILKYRQRHPNK